MNTVSANEFIPFIVILFLMRITSNDVFYEPKITVSKVDTYLLPSEKGYRIQINVRLNRFPLHELNSKYGT